MYNKMTEEEFDNLLDRFHIEYEKSESVYYIYLNKNYSSISEIR